MFQSSCLDCPSSQEFDIFQSSSLDFLMSQGFDFNKLFREGISYLRPADEAKLREELQRKNDLPSPAFISPTGTGSLPGSNKGPVDVPPEHKNFIDNIWYMNSIVMQECNLCNIT